LSIEHFYGQIDAALGLFYAASALTGALGTNGVSIILLGLAAISLALF
jgi:hypothetical protein